MTNLTDELDMLVSENPTLGEILQTSPYDANKNIGGLLSEEIFFSHIFVKSQSFSDLSTRLTKTLISDLENIRVLVLDGFGGTGKTTFVRHYMRLTSPQFNHVYIDFHAFARSVESEAEAGQSRRNIGRAIEILDGQLSQEAEQNSGAKEQIRRARNLLGSLDHPSNPIVSIIKGYLSKADEATLTDCLYFIYSKLKPLSAYVSKNLLSEIQNTPRRQLGERSHFILNACDFSDTFLIFFLFCFRAVDRNKVTLAFFDNLDAVNLDYLSDYFRQSFARVLSTATLLAQDKDIFSSPIEFARRFKFIFCLRDANGAILNAHIADSIGHTSRTVNFRVRFDGDLYKQIVEKRVRFYSALQEKRGALDPQDRRSSDQVVRILENFAQDRYFQNVAVPLFNSDFRRLALALFDVAKILLRIPAECHSLSLLDFNSTESTGQYGLRGSLLFGLIRFLREDNFLEEYPFLELKNDSEEGYCLHSRMVLTALLNNSDLRQSSDVMDPRSSFAAVPLGDLVRQITPVYPVSEVVATLVDAFLFHERNWVHLVTFRNKSVSDRKAFDDQIRYMEQLSDAIAASETSGPLEDLDFTRLDGVTVSLNPAGFVYLKSLITHFEFYSNLASGEMPLFSTGLREASRDKKLSFLFEEYISNVQKIVRRHIMSMAMFFKTVFETKMHWDINQYRKSVFAFKHLGEGAPKMSGYFHSTRLLTAHIDYVDKFRLYLVRSMLRSSETETASKVNESLVGAIERYVQMFDLSVDVDATSFRDRFRERIRIIRTSSFKDFDTEIGALSYTDRPRQV